MEGILASHGGELRATEEIDGMGGVSRVSSSLLRRQRDFTFSGRLESSVATHSLLCGDGAFGGGEGALSDGDGAFGGGGGSDVLIFWDLLEALSCSGGSVNVVATDLTCSAGNTGQSKRGTAGGSATVLGSASCHLVLRLDDLGVVEPFSGLSSALHLSGLL